MLKGSKKYQLQDLIEKIEEADKMIKAHSKNSSKLMLEQYEAKKQKLLGYLIDELVDAKVRSPYSFKLIYMALHKFYPKLMKSEYKETAGTSKELKSLEAVLAA
jgi:ribosomal protein S15P/S13E